MATARGVIRWVGRNGKRIAITVVGFVLILGGLVLLVLPGPGMLVIIAGLAVLGTEYMWARRMLDLAKQKAKETAARVRKNRKKNQAG